eukprot:TRINITY_DN72400_c0_g1_i1.p1 TRINITY_DN72400_c0_g1~~TRINITY_DN72400_c0_g1_i1.p1  ORF type:complete len:122 (-),score=9.35 TRINITY_DN72400_c0_g1_i1:11-376(-)
MNLMELSVLNAQKAIISIIKTNAKLFPKLVEYSISQLENVKLAILDMLSANKINVLLLRNNRLILTVKPLTVDFVSNVPKEHSSMLQENVNLLMLFVRHSTQLMVLVLLAILAMKSKEILV